MSFLSFRKPIDHAEESRLICAAREKLWQEFRRDYKHVPMDEWEAYFADWHKRYVKGEVQA